MKKIITLVITVLFALTCQAQLKVDSLGCTRIGSSIPSTNNSTIQKYDATVNASKNLGALYIQNFSNSASRYGINVSLNTSDSNPVGVNSMVFGGFGGNITCGIKGLATGGYNPIGIAGGVEDDPGVINCIGVCGSLGYNVYLPTSGHNYYAGYFQGDVRATGSIYGTLLSPSSTFSNEGNSTPIETRGNEESVSNKFQQVALLQLERKNQNGSLAANRTEGELLEINLSGVGENRKVSADSKKHIVQTELSSVSYGLAADQLKEVYPELVYEDEQGNYSINYIEMVPLLVQSIKELSSEISALKQQLGTQEALKKTKKQTASADDTEMEVVSMSQNRPNPFKDKSVITLNVPSDTKKAVINIYDMSGKQVQSIPVSERGRTNITVYARHLQPGMFVYSLLVDGKMQTTRKMMVTE